ncbi:MAG: S41 family peptidase [Phycisphaerales bacterium]
MQPVFGPLLVLNLLALVGPVACAAAPSEQPADATGADSGSISVSVRSAVSADASARLVGLPRFPALSPDGRSLVFSWAGDLWFASLPADLPASGHVAVIADRLTSHPADESRAVFSPDGASLAFESDRDGARNIYVMALGSLRDSSHVVASEARRLTFSDAAQTIGSFSADGASVFFSSGQEPSLYRQARLYSVSLADGHVQRLTDAQGFLPRATPDGNLLFSRGSATLWNRPIYRGSAAGDVFRLNTADQSFRRLTNSGANDGNAFQTPDGSLIFTSSRSGQNNLWKLAPGAADDAAATQLTNVVVPAGKPTIGHGVADASVSLDGSRAAFTVWDTLYVLNLRSPADPIAIAASASGDTAVPDALRLALDRQVSEAALSPDGKTLAVVARGEVFVRSTDEGRPTRRVTRTPARERDLAWSPDGATLYFASDPRGVYEVHQATVSFARDDLDPQPAEPDQKPAADARPAPAGDEADGAAVKPDAPAPAQPASDATTPQTDKPAAVADKPKPPPKPDPGKRWADSILFDVHPLISIADDDVRFPQPSPDGRQLAFVRGRGDLYIRDLSSGADRKILSGWDAPEMIWAGDSRHIIYAVQDLDYNSDIWLADSAAQDPGAAALNLTRHPDTDTAPRLTADGKILTFLSERAGDNGEFDVWQVYLDKKLEGLKPYELDEYYKKAAEAAGKRKPLDLPSDKPAKPAGELSFDAADAYLRVRRITSNPGPESDLAITPAADRIIFSVAQDTDTALVSIDRKGEDKKVLQAGAVSRVASSLTGEKVSFIRAGVVNTAPTKGGKTETLAIDAPVTIELAAQQRQKFLEAARILGTRFYHSTMKGLDWDALTAAYLSLAMQTRTTDEFNDVVQMLFGELNGSHTGISGPPATDSAPRPSIGLLGVESRPVAQGHQVARVFENSPADQPQSRLYPGDVIIGIDGVPLTQWPRPAGMSGVPDLTEALLGKAGKETLLEVQRADPTLPTHVLIVPASAGGLSQVAYLEGIKQRRVRVEELSAGQIGYLHIRSMSEPSVRDFERDLYAAAHGKKGLIIDVRDNGGGFTTDILLASLTAPVHAKTAPRGVDPSDVPSDAYPRDRRLIYGYSRPINVLINENSFSNAEVFAHAIHNINRGSLIGKETFGAVISTGSASLVDGTTVRVPGRGWWMPDGRDMENNGAAPDVAVEQTPEDDAAARDAQLEAAVRELLGRVSK